ncbi:tRNA-specific adenosine deaminase-like [Ylistrum balloti]|uniref:tRNA-specific adenosine deaminase-like n=1 Tax=Ylistrum balloti TaxID=509963 RepID=UPI002905878A|nr:tRNA-specific adenosine deaminase-like [Ylistrum balloti]
MLNKDDRYWMQQALLAAHEAKDLGEVPVGAVVVHKSTLIARAFNRKEAGDPTAHAEILALREAAQYLKNWRLRGCILYVTLEPCLMCAGAVIQSRVDRIVYGATDLKFGAVESMLNSFDYAWNHQPQVTGGICQQESASLLTSFFANRRKTKDNKKHKS